MERKETRDRKPEPYSSNAIRLSGREWLIVAAFALVIWYALPPLWERAEKLASEPDYRMPYELSGDYWLFSRYSRAAAQTYDTLLVGDSVVWGQYVTRPQTLSHYLNELAGAERVANLGLDGTHPIALAGLLEHYARGIADKKVILHCNPLWMSSTKHDLQADDDIRINHPRLLPQFTPRIPSYKESVTARLGIIVERNTPFNGWTNHLQQAYFRDKNAPLDIPAWTVENPYENPLKPVTLVLPPSGNELRHEAISWTERGVRKADFPWLEPETSLQWRAFQRAVALLQQRGNTVFVLVGPFNEHMLTDRSREGYARLKRGIEDWLRAKNVAYVAPQALPSELYADASHPLSEGYRLLAKQVFEAFPPLRGGQ